VRRVLIAVIAAGIISTPAIAQPAQPAQSQSSSNIPMTGNIDDSSLLSVPTLLLDEPCTGNVGIDVNHEPVPFYAQAFRVDFDGVYVIQTEHATWEKQDTVLALYESNFDPTNPLRNLIAVNDDQSKNDYRAKLTCALQTNKVYVLVTLPFDAVQRGRFVNSIAPLVQQAGTRRISEVTVQAARTTATLRWSSLVETRAVIHIGSNIRVEVPSNSTHNVLIEGLAPDTWHEYVLVSTDSSGRSWITNGRFYTVK
jgi:hypothetical protein